MDRDRVDFLIAGVQKGGTTALHAQLQRHPALGLPDEKELHFFDDEAQDWSAPDLAAYHARFAGLEGRARLGEATPIYLYWAPALERIARYRADMRLVLVFRDPVERAWSHWRMEKARGFDAAPFAWAIREGRARVDDPASPGQHRVYSYVERGFYAPQLARAHALFGRERVLALRSEDLDADPGATVAQVSRFLGVAPPEVPPPPLRANVGVSRDLGSRLTDEDRALLAGLYAEDLAAFGAASGLDVAGWARG
ncbi:MAG: sulfotransferase [Caulobacteraceae bacterium]|nr:sulfotransferase [Caulobacter sp.]